MAIRVRFRRIRERGVLEQERLVFEVVEAGDIGKCAVFRVRELPNGKVSAKVSDVCWFPDKTVAAGDVVVLYTKAGNQNEKSNDDGSTSYFFYWGLSEAIWVAEDHVPVFIYIRDWDIMKEPRVVVRAK